MKAAEWIWDQELRRWVRVYLADTWLSWVGYGTAFALFCVTIGIWL